jgi:hypothetical protein
MITVRDYDTAGGRWLVWQTSSLQRSYIDYPYEGVQDFPPTSGLAGQVHVTAEPPTVPLDQLSSLQPSTLWEELNVLGNVDFVPGFNLSGHTGLWGVSIFEPAVEDNPLRGLLQDGEDLVPQTDEDNLGSILTTDRIEVYPLDTGLPDSKWLSIGDDIVLNSDEEQGNQFIMI